jgi:hypothetical protein
MTMHPGLFLGELAAWLALLHECERAGVATRAAASGTAVDATEAHRAQRSSPSGSLAFTASLDNTLDGWSRPPCCARRPGRVAGAALDDVHQADARRLVHHRGAAGAAGRRDVLRARRSPTTRLPNAQQFKSMRWRALHRHDLRASDEADRRMPCATSAAGTRRQKGEHIARGPVHGRRPPAGGEPVQRKVLRAASAAARFP